MVDAWLLAISCNCPTYPCPSIAPHHPFRQLHSSPIVGLQIAGLKANYILSELLPKKKKKKMWCPVRLRCLKLSQKRATKLLSWAKKLKSTYSSLSGNGWLPIKHYPIVITIISPLAYQLWNIFIIKAVSLYSTFPNMEEPLLEERPFRGQVLRLLRSELIASFWMGITGKWAFVFKATVWTIGLAIV